jgi:hypothetical protein
MQKLHSFNHQKNKSMKSANFIRIYEVLREEIGVLSKLNWEIYELEKRRVRKSVIETEKLKYTLLLEHFRGMCDLANLTGEFTYPDGRSSIDSEFGWIFQ